MFQQIYEKLKPFRFRLTIIGLLCAASLTSVALFRIRTLLSGTMDYDFLVWNLFLAWLPLGMAYTASSFATKRRFVALTVPIAAALWLIFFPNAPYMLTDLQDLARRAGDAPLWYDVLIVVWCSWTGMLLGVISLYLMQDIVQRAFSRFTGWAFVFIISGLSSFGIYIGRFVRLNSWDILQNPTETAMDILGVIIDPSRRLAAFTLLYTFFFLFVYLLLYSFSHLLREQAVNAQSLPEQLAATQQTNVKK